MRAFAFAGKVKQTGAATRAHALGEALTRKALHLHRLGDLPRQNFLYGHGLECIAGASPIEKCVQRRETLGAAAFFAVVAFVSAILPPFTAPR